MNNNEINILTFIVYLAQSSDNTVEYENDKVYELLNNIYSKQQIKGYLSSLQLKGMIEVFEDCYYDGQITEKGIEFLNKYYNEKLERRN